MDALSTQPNCKMRQFEFNYSKPVLTQNWGELEVSISITMYWLEVRT